MSVWETNLGMQRTELFLFSTAWFVEMTVRSTDKLIS